MEKPRSLQNMKRSSFLRLAGIGLLGASATWTEGSAALDRCPEALRSWILRHQASAESSSGLWTIEVSWRQSKLDECLQELVAISEGSVQAHGDSLQGRSCGEAYLLKLTAG